MLIGIRVGLLRAARLEVRLDDTQNFCRNVDAFVAEQDDVIQDNEVVARRPDFIPQLYSGCGNAYEGPPQDNNVPQGAPMNEAMGVPDSDLPF